MAILTFNNSIMNYLYELGAWEASIFRSIPLCKQNNIKKGLIVQMPVI